MKHMRNVVLTLAVIAFMGCGTDQREEPKGEAGYILLNSALTSSAEELTGDDVAGFLYQIFDADGVFLEEKYIPLEAESLPDFIAPEQGDNHSFADAFFVLLPGWYHYVVTPMQDENTPSEICAPVEGDVQVFAETTVEEILVSECTGEDTGGLDITTYLNHKPIIMDLEYSPSKYVMTCEELTVTVTAEDIDNDPLTYEFELMDAPDGADPSFGSSDGEFYFMTDTAGTYWVKVTITDPNGSMTALEFPIHVSFEEGDCEID